jgi:hypothetical protein
MRVIEQDEQRVLERVRPYEVDFLYKYRSMSSQGLERIFSHNEIFLTDPTTFNDPFDCKPFIVTHTSAYKRKKFYETLVKHRFPNATKKEIKQEVRRNPRFKKIKQQQNLEELYNKFLKRFGLYCLTEVPDDILMWSHYADSHKGICLQFRANEVPTLFWEAFKVTYQEDYPIVNIMDMGNWEQFFNALATKSKHWEYEKERRIIKTEDEGGPGVYTFSPKLLTGVILGVHISESDKKLISKWVSSHETPVKVLQANLNKR